MSKVMNSFSNACLEAWEKKITGTQLPKKNSVDVQTPTNATPQVEAKVIPPKPATVPINPQAYPPYILAQSFNYPKIGEMPGYTQMQYQPQ